MERRNLLTAGPPDSGAQTKENIKKSMGIFYTENLNPVKQPDLFDFSLPLKPYCADDLGTAPRILPTLFAKEKRYIRRCFQQKKERLCYPVSSILIRR